MYACRKICQFLFKVSPLSSGTDLSEISSQDVNPNFDAERLTRIIQGEFVHPSDWERIIEK